MRITARELGYRKTVQYTAMGYAERYHEGGTELGTHEMERLSMCVLESKEKRSVTRRSVPLSTIPRVRWDAATSSRSGVVFNHPSSTNIECLSSCYFLIIPEKE